MTTTSTITFCIRSLTSACILSTITPQTLITCPRDPPDQIRFFLQIPFHIFLSNLDVECNSDSWAFGGEKNCFVGGTVERNVILKNVFHGWDLSIYAR